MIDRQIQINNKQISITQDLSLSHAGTVWDGALCFIAFLNKNKSIAIQYLENKNVLQLGSGTGILGLASSTFKPKNMYLTDLPQYLTLLQTNLQKNSHILETSHIEIHPLKWNNQQNMKKIYEQIKIDTIIGSQLAYDVKCTQDLMKTIIKFKQINPQLKIMISFQKYLQTGKNIQIQFGNYFGKMEYKLIDWHLMDHEMRDEGIGIITI